MHENEIDELNKAKVDNEIGELKDTNDIDKRISVFEE